MKSQRRLPPIWLSATALTAAITVAFGVIRWVDHFLSAPDAEDFRLHLVAARVGMQYGWSHIYDLDLMKAASAGLGSVGSLVDTNHVFMSPPPAAWMVAPIADLPLPAGYLLWTLISVMSFVAAWWLVVPGSRLFRVTVLLISLALWPVHYQFWLGQWVVATLALLALSWWLLERDRWLLAGVVLALSMLFKPQDVLLVPLALLVSGRWKPVAVAAVTGGAFAAWSLASLGQSGVQSWLSIAGQIHADPFQAPMTYLSLLGRGALTTGVEVLLGIAALVTACIFFGWRIGTGFGLGATIAYLNFHWLKKVVSGLAELTIGSGTPASSRGVVHRFLLRYFLMAIIAFVILTLSRESLYGLFAGLFLPVAAILCEAAYELYAALVHKI